MRKRILTILVSITTLFLCTIITNQTALAEDFSVNDESHNVSSDYNYDFPYASVVRLSTVSACTGTVVGSDYVLTAAHCNRSEHVVLYYGKRKVSFGINKNESYYHPNRNQQGGNDFALLKLYRADFNGRKVHIGELRKPLPILGYDAAPLLRADGRTALIGFPNGQPQRQVKTNINIVKTDRAYVRGDFNGGGGGMSGSPLLNSQGQIMGVYHGSTGGSIAFFSLVNINDLLEHTDIASSTSRIYLWKNKGEYEQKRRENNPTGDFIEKNNNDLVNMEEIFKLANNKLGLGYHVTALTDGVRTFDSNSSIKMPIGGLELYPKEISPNRYEINFDANGGNGTMESQTMTFDEENHLVSNNFKKVGYIFKNWNTQADGKGQNYSEGSLVKNLTSENNGKITLYAQWVLDSGLTSKKPNWIQVTDKRGTNAGWKLQVQQGAQFFTIKDGVYKELKGAQITINNCTVATTTDNKATAPTTSNKIILIPGILNHPGPVQDVMIAQMNQGMGTWVDSFGSATTGDKSIALTVPGVSEKIKGAKYSTELTWLLNDTPT